MSAKSYQLRKKPLLEFTFNENDFRLIDTTEPANNGNFKYNLIDSVELVSGKTNWFISFISLVTDFLRFGAFDIYKEKDRLVIQLKSSKIEILLFRVDKEKVEALITRLKQSVGN
jgi:hypothetical protein